MNYYIGLSLSASSGMDSGVAVMDEDCNLILVDKLYTMNDVMFFFDNYPMLKYSKICTSLGATSLVAGSYIYGSKDYRKAIESL